MPFSWFKLIFYVCIQTSWLIEGCWHFFTLFLWHALYAKWWLFLKRLVLYSMTSTQKMTFPNSLSHLDHCSKALCPRWGGEAPQPLKMKIYTVIHQYSFRCKCLPLYAWNPCPPPKQQSRGALLSLVLYCCWALFQEHRKPEIRVKLLIRRALNDFYCV